MNDLPPNNLPPGKEGAEEFLRLEGEEDLTVRPSRFTRQQLGLPDGPLPNPTNAEEPTVVVCLDGLGVEDTTTRPLPPDFPLHGPPHPRQPSTAPAKDTAAGESAAG